MTVARATVFLYEKIHKGQGAIYPNEVTLKDVGS